MTALIYRLNYLAATINTLLLASQEFRDLPVSAALRKQAAEQLVNYAKVKCLIKGDNMTMQHTRQDVLTLKNQVLNQISLLDVLLENILKINDNPTSEIYFRPENYINLNDKIDEIITILTELAAISSQENLQPSVNFWTQHKKNFVGFVDEENTRLFTLKVAVVKPLYDKIQASYELALSSLDSLPYKN